MAYSKEAQKRYREKSIQFAVNYRPGTDIQEGQRVKAYLEQTGQTANSYIKALIKADLDCKRFMMVNSDQADHAGNVEGGEVDKIADDNKLPWEE